MKIDQKFALSVILLLTLIVTINCSPSLTPTAKNSPAGISTNKPIQVGVNSWPPSLYWEIAEEKGIFQANQIEVDLNYYDYLKSIRKLTQGELDANYLTLSDIITALTNPDAPDLVIVLLADASNGGDAIIVREGINSIADLKGKKIATEIGGTDHFLVLLGLKKAGISPQEIYWQNLDPRAGVAAFVEGQVDAIATYIPYTKEALKLSGSKVLFSSKQFPQAITDHLVVSRKLINQRPQDVQSLVNSWFDTLKFAHQNSDQAFTIMADYFGVSVEEFKLYNSEIKIFNHAENLKFFVTDSPLAYLPQAAEEFSKFLLSNGIIKHKPDLRQLFDDRFVRAYLSSLKN